MKKLSDLLISFIVIITIANAVVADDCQQWRGAARDGVYKETGLLKSWPEQGPKLLWYAEGIGSGYSSPIVADGKLYITGLKRDQELITAFDLQGKRLWQVTYGKAYTGSFAGARSTPCLVAGHLFAITSSGEVACVDVNGKLKWNVNARQKFAGERPRFGVAESPLVVDNKVFYTCGGDKTMVVALNIKDGSTSWQSPSLQDSCAYTAPQVITYGGKQQLVTVSSTYIFGLDVANGKLQWKINYHQAGHQSRRWYNNVNTPLVKDGRIFVTSGYDHGGVMLALNQDASAAKVLWTTADLDTHHGGVVLVDGYIYGSNWLNNKRGNWVCIDWQTGKTQYETRWGGKGSIITADGMLYCYEELRGNLGLVPANPKSFKVISSFKIRKGNRQHWSHPVISDGKLYLRRGKGIMAYDIRQK